MACILLAEDDDSLRPFLERALTRAGHLVLACARGDQALGYLREGAGLFDVLITDVMMPALDGVSLAKQAAQIDPAVRILFITGFAAVVLNPANGLATPDAVLSKPFHLRDLVRALDGVLAATSAA